MRAYNVDNYLELTPHWRLLRIGSQTRDMSADRLPLICFLKTGPFGIGIFRVFSLGLGGTRDDEGIEIFGRAEGVHIEAGHGGVPVAEICRRAGISQATYFNWKKKYEGLSPPEMRHLKRLEEENAKLRKLVADLSLDREMLQDVIRRKL